MGIAKLLGAAALLASVSSAAIAADLPSRKAPAPVYAAPVFTWTGFYLGLNAGGIVANTTGTVDTVTPNIAILAPSFPTVSASNFGFIGGAQAGFNWQSGSFVFGVEGDIAFTTAKGTQSFAVPTIIPGIFVTGNAQAKLDYLATIRGRIGYTITPTMLAYVTGGLAIGGGSVSATAAAFPLPFVWAGSAPSTRAGWTLGAGLEYALSNNWSLKGEYLYYNLGESKLVASEFLLPSAATYNVKRDGHVFRLGVNYRFGAAPGPVVAKY